MKKYLAIVIMAVICFSLTGCFDENGNYYSTGIESDAFAGIKVVYVANDEFSNNKLVNYYEKFALNFLINIWGNYGSGINAGTYSIVEGAVVENGENYSSITLESGIIPFQNEDMTTYPYSTNKNAIFKSVYSVIEGIPYAVAWSMNNGFNPTSDLTNATFINYSTVYYKQIVKEIMFAILNLSNEDIATYNAMDYVAVTSTLAGKIDHFGFLQNEDATTIDELDRIVERLKNAMLGTSNTYSSFDNGLTYTVTNSTGNTLALDNQNINDTSNYLFKNYAITFKNILETLADDETYYVAPKVYVQDLLLTENGISKPENKQYLSYIYMPTANVGINDIGYFFQNLQVGETLSAKIHLKLCSNLNDAGSVSSTRNDVNFDFEEIVGAGINEQDNDELIEISIAEQSLTANYLKNGYVFIRTFTNNTPSSEPILVGFENDYEQFFKLVANHDGVGSFCSYNDMTTDYFEMQMSIEGGDNLFYIDEFNVDYLIY